VRQQWNFSSPDATRETEDYAIDLSNVTVLDLILDLIIDPDQGHTAGAMYGIGRHHFF
jgi:hypothetical protein